MGKRWKIYTAGKMSGLSFEEQVKWRFEIACKIHKCKQDSDILFIHPPYYFNYEENLHQTEAEILEWEMSQLHDCDVVIVNLDGIEDSIGTHMELGAIQGINRFSEKHIFVVGFGNPNKTLHPWIKETCIRIEENIDDLVSYITEYLLV